MKFLLRSFVLFASSFLGYGQSELPNPILQTKDRILQIRSINGTGTGFILDNGLVMTASHVVTSTPYIVCSYRDTLYQLLPVFKDRSLDISVLYVSGFIKYDRLVKVSENSFSKFIGNSQIKYGMPKSNEKILALGYPYGITELKRVKGEFKGISQKKGLLACDLPPIRGMSGGPVYSELGEVIGVSSSFEIEPTDTDYLVSYLIPVDKINQMMKAIDLNLVASNILMREKSEIASFEVLNASVTGLIKIDEDDLENCIVTNGGSSLRSTDSYSRWEPKYPMDTANIYGDFLFEKGYGESNVIRLYIKYLNKNNYVSFDIDLKKESFYLTYFVNGKAKKKESHFSFPVYQNEVYNIEFFTKNKNFIVYFDNVPVFLETDLPFSRGTFGFVSDGLKYSINNLTVRMKKN